MNQPGLSRSSIPCELLLALVAIVTLGACSPKPEATVTGEPAEAAPAVQRYEARGVVSRLPTESAPALYVRHETIPDFVGMDGEVVGMDSMTMPFPLADGVDLAGIEPGDKVAFTLEVEWEGDLPYRISRIEELPPDTALDLGG
jgi:Cu/Ag efflux protein CusF